MPNLLKAYMDGARGKMFAPSLIEGYMMEKGRGGGTPEPTVTGYYATYTDGGTLYYLDIIPEIGDTGLNMYDSDLNLIATDGAVTTITLSNTTYPLITSEDLNLLVVRWNDSGDITV